MHHHVSYTSGLRSGLLKKIIHLQSGMEPCKQHLIFGQHFCLYLLCLSGGFLGVVGTHISQDTNLVYENQE